jgi:hypothetical protein
MSHQTLVNLHQAITNLNPSAQVSATGIDDITWHVGTPTSKSDLEAEISRIEATNDVQAYARNRKAEYDALNQFELMTDDAANSTTTHADAITVIKTKWPKNNTGPVE